MSLEEEVQKLMDEPVEASVPLLDAMMATRDPDAPLDTTAFAEIVMAQLVGLKRAILRLAREIEQTRDV